MNVGVERKQSISTGTFFETEQATLPHVSFIRFRRFLGPTSQTVRLVCLECQRGLGIASDKQEQNVLPCFCATFVFASLNDKEKQ